MEKTKKSKKNPHNGHRARVFDEVHDGGIPFFTDIKLLETALFFVKPRSDTNVVAHNLLDTFGSVEGVVNADPLQICGVEGCGQRTADFFTVLSEIYRRVNLSDGKKGKIFFSIDQIGKFFVNKFKGVNKERVMLLTLDNKNAFIDCRVIHEGTVSSSTVSVRDIMKVALDFNATRIVVAHNHPLGNASPSDDDIVLTRMLRRALTHVDVDFVEHILVADGNYMPLMSYITRASDVEYLN